MSSAVDRALLVTMADQAVLGAHGSRRRYQHPAKPPGVHVVVTVADQAPLLGRAAGRDG